MIFHDLKITGNGRQCEITLDGQKINGVYSVEFSAAVDDIPRLKLELFIGKHDIDIQVLNIEVEEKEDGK
ncbi:hypothetical protein [Paenibacillus sp. sgz302251]|uniref:hypothetical protein n=1 Tax=Paenibacillus sp. sgz302251 TaxID=3414493 RepID=UPI003C7AD8C0